MYQTKNNALSKYGPMVDVYKRQAYTYGKSKKLDIKNGLVMMSAVLCFTLVGSYLSSVVSSTAMGGFSTVMTLVLGIKFLIKPVMTTKAVSYTHLNPFIQAIIFAWNLKYPLERTCFSWHSRKKWSKI